MGRLTNQERLSERRPPQWAERLLIRFGPEGSEDELVGDMQEMYDYWVKTVGVRKARRRYTLAVLRLIRPFHRSEKQPDYTNPPTFILHPDMIHNYLKIAWRNLLQDRLFALLNLIGLSMGLICIVLIYLWADDELRMNHHNQKDEQLYQVMANYNGEDAIKTVTHTPGLLANALTTELPEAEYAVSVIPASWFSNKGVISVNDNHVKAGAQFVGKDYFNVFTCPFLLGDSHRLFDDNQTVALSETLALKVFGTTTGILGKMIQWNHREFSGTYRIGGIFKNIPINATQPFDILFNFDLFVEKRPAMKSWGNSDPSTFLIVRKGTDMNRFSAKIKDFVRNKYKAAYGTKNLHWIATLFLQRYSDTYLHNVYVNGAPNGGRIEYVKMFSMIAFVILVIACINFMNLSTAKAAARMKEAGIKKVMGANRQTLITQYLSESILMSFAALLIALIGVMLILPLFNSISGKQLSLQINEQHSTALVAITLVTGILAGSYPAFYLSGFKPAAVLKGKLPTSLGQLWMRKGLIVFQFALSVFFIVAVLVIYRQMEFIRAKNLGYDRNNLIHFSNEGRIQEHQQAFLAELRTIQGVLYASSMSGDLMGNHGGGGGVDWAGKTTQVEFSGLYVDYDLIEALNLNIVKGRSFSKRFGTDSAGVIFNEAAIEAMGLKNPVGKTVTMWGQQKQIVGIVKDFHFESLYNKVGPFFLSYEPHANNILVKIQPGKTHRVLGQVEQLYRRYNLGLPFDYRFLDQDYQALYASEQRAAILSRYFAELAIVISCLGLFGLTAFTAQRRQREIGIRKVVGATADNIVMMLSVDFLKPVLLSMLIAFPIASWILKIWLTHFAYHIEVGADIYLITSSSVLLMALLIVSYQALKAALTNPVTAIRTQ